MMKRNVFLIGMTSLMLAFGMTGCDSATSGAAQKVLQGMTSYTIVLGNVASGATYTAVVYDGADATGGGVANAENGSASIRLTPANGKPPFSERVYRVQVSSGTTVKESASVAFVSGGNTHLNWGTMTVISGEPDDENTPNPPESRTYTSGSVTLTLTEIQSSASRVLFSISSPAAGEKFYYVLYVNGRKVSGGTVTIGAERWTFVPDTDGGKTFYAEVSGDSLIFPDEIAGAGKLPLTADGEDDGEEEDGTEASYGIDLSKSGTHVFAPVTGEAAPDSLTVTIVNTGSQPTGNLTVALSSASAFTLSTTTISSIPADGSDSFAVTPKTGLAEGTYTATVTVSGGHGISEGFGVNWTVNPPATTPVYGIALSESEAYTFQDAIAGYGAQASKSLTVTNTGNQPTGNLTLALSSSSAFTLSATSMGSIAAGGSNSFTVTPKTGLSAGTYNATVTVNGANIAAKSFDVNFTVTQAATYGISVDVSGTHTFPGAIAGYGAQTSKSVTVSNTGNQPTGNLTLALSSSSAFTLSATSMGSIAAGSSNSFTVTPQTGLSEGTYTATVTVSGGNGIFAGFNVSFTVNPPAVTPVYGLALSETGTYPFPPATAGYGTQTAKSVTITNTGNQPTGNLTLALSSSSAFTLSATSVQSIAAGGYNSFTVTPKTGLSAGTHTATVTVSGGSNITSKSFSVSFTVNPAIYSIDLSAETYTFPDVTAGYGTQTAKSVTITNTGNQPTGNLTLALSSSSAFTLSATSVQSIAAGGSNSFTVTPKTGLAAGTYTATVTVSGSNITSKSFSVGFTVNPAPTYGISLNPETWTFPAATAGYGTQTAKSVTITNTGNQPTGNLTLALSSSSAFTLSATSMGSIAAGGSNSFTVTPKTGLAAGTYTATVTVSGGSNITSKSFSVSFTVNALIAPEGGWTSVADASAYLAAQSGENTVDNPVPLKMNVNLSSATDGWYALVTALASNGKYVALDLSDSSVSSGQFSTGTGAGNAYIVTLILPDATTSIVGGNQYLASGVLASIKTISGANVTSISGWAFQLCRSLSAVSFPKATSIGVQAFNGCFPLTSVSFPEVTSIGNQAFVYCGSLTTAFFPKATSIGSYALAGNRLTTVSLPEATTIGYNAFQSCKYLTTVDIPKVTSIGSYAFRSSGTTPLTITMGAVAPTVGIDTFYDISGSRTVTIRVPSGATGYTNAWQETFKGGNSYINLVMEYDGASITLSQTEAYTFPAATAGYGAQTAKSVTVTNTGNQATGNLTLALSSSSAFTLSATSVSSIATSGSNSFTVTPKTGLSAGTYTATVTVSGSNITSKSFSVSFTVNPAATYGISLNQSGTWTFPAATAGYGTQTAKSVTITNTGNQPSGNLTVALSSSSAFTLSATSVSSIAASGSNSFTVTPKTGLSAGTYTATVTVSGSNITSKSFSVSFTVNPAATYGISLNQSGTHTFPSATAGYGAQASKSVTVSNTGNQPTGNLTLALSSSSAFTLSATSMGSIAAGGSNSFTVTPKTGLAAGTYTATVTVSGSSVTSKNFSVSFTVNPAATYGISLNQSGIWTFPAATAGYGTQTAKSVTVTNTGNQPTGSLTLALSSSSAFTLSATSMGSIAASGSNSFTVTPKTGLAAGTYTATVTVSGSSVTSKNFSVSFTVSPAPTYNMSLNPSGTYAFPSATVGYGTQTAKSVTVTNTGNQPTGSLTLALSSSSAFTLSATSISSIAASGSNSFTVTPKTGLAAGTYTATVTVIGGIVGTRSLDVSFTVNPVPTYGVNLDPSGTYAFPAAIVGYGAQTAKSVTITNTGNQPTGNLTLALSSSSAFTLSATSISSIAAGGSNSFTVTPKTGLAAGTYTATVTVSGGSNITAKSVIVSFIVEDPSITGFSSVAAALAYLESYAGGSSFNAPVPLKMNINLDSATDGWTALLNGLATVNKYVALDLSSCTKSSTGFSFSSGNNGTKCIAALTLPDSVTSITGSSTTHGWYPNLKIISGANVTSIGASTFHSCSALTTANFSKATTIGNEAFYWCTSLTTASFPEATSIGTYAFYKCTSLTTASFPEATSIGDYAFSGCTSLTMASFPEATTVGGFSGCTALTTAAFPKATTVERSAFSGCTYLTTLSLPKVTSIGEYAFMNSGTVPLAITFGDTMPPTIGGQCLFHFQPVPTVVKTVTVRVPNGATGYTAAWQSAFKGRYITSDTNGDLVTYVSTYINVVMEYY